MTAELMSQRVLHDGWCKLHQVRFRTAEGQEFTREVEEHGDAIAVLPYDPERRTLLFVRLMRAPVLLASGEEHLLEAPAGMIDKEEDPETAARREALEEVGVRLDALEPVVTGWTSPGVSTERLSLFLASYSERDIAGNGGGVDGEHEGIDVLELPISDAWESFRGAQRAVDLKTFVLLLALKERHPELF